MTLKGWRVVKPQHNQSIMYKIMILQKPLSTKFRIGPTVEMWLIVYSNDYAPLTVRPIYSSSELRTAQMMIFSLVAMIGLEKCCITSAYLQWLCHSGERVVAHGPLVLLATFWEFQHFNLVSKISQKLFKPLPCHKSIGKMLHAICISAVAVTLRWASYGPGPHVLRLHLALFLKCQGF